MTSSQRSKASSWFSVQDMVLVVLETIFSLIYKHDSRVRALCRPLVEAGLVVECYIDSPHIHFYIRFTEQGWLFSAEYPQPDRPTAPSTTNGSKAHAKKVHLASKSNVDVRLKASATNLGKLLLLGDTQMINEIYLTGDESLQQPVLDLLQHLNVLQIVKDASNDLFSDEARVSRTRYSTRQLSKQLQEQRSGTRQLTTQLREVRDDLAEVQKSYHRLKLFSIAITIAFVASLLLLAYQYYYGL